MFNRPRDSCADLEKEMAAAMIDPEIRTQQHKDLTAAGQKRAAAMGQEPFDPKRREEFMKSPTAKDRCGKKGPRDSVAVARNEKGQRRLGQRYQPLDHGDHSRIKGRGNCGVSAS